MDGSKAATAGFKRGCCVFDKNLRLVVWDAGFEIEFATARHLMKPGAHYRDIMEAVLASNPQFSTSEGPIFGADALKKTLEDSVAAFGTVRSSMYRTTGGQIVRVEHTISAAGDHFRIAEDATEEWNARQELVAAKQRLADATHGVGVPFSFTVTPDGVSFPTASVELKRLYGLPDDVVCSDIMMLYSRVEMTPEERAESTAAARRSIETLDPYMIEFRLRDIEGNLRWIRTACSPRRGPDGSVIFEGVVTDITREKLAHDQIDLLRAVVVQSSDSVIIVESRPSGESEILYVNPTFERIFGRTLGELAGMSTLEYSADPTDDIVAKQVAERLAAGSINPFEFQVAGPDGALIWVEARVVTLQRQPDGTVRWAVISARIDERKRVEGELIDARDVAETASRIKSRFLANMSHELRTPLNAIIGFSEIMKNELLGPIGNTKYRGYIEDINSSGQHLLQIVNDVLEMSRIEAGKLELDEQEVEVAAVVRAALRFLQLTAAGAGVVFSPDLPPDLPRLFCDEMRVKQILLNLLSNAVKFSHAGDTIVIGGAVNPDGSLVISVIDTGIGMTEAEIASAFEPFHQIETELSRRNDGTGLGLPLARSLIQLHGGRLELRSEPGAGTTADIIFPPARVLPPAPRWPDPAPTKRARAPAV